MGEYALVKLQRGEGKHPEMCGDCVMCFHLDGCDSGDWPSGCTGCPNNAEDECTVGDGVRCPACLAAQDAAELLAREAAALETVGERGWTLYREDGVWAVAWDHGGVIATGDTPVMAVELAMGLNEKGGA